MMSQVSKLSLCLSKGFACYRFRGGAEAGTWEQAGPERAPEAAYRTFVHPVEYYLKQYRTMGRSYKYKGQR